MDGEALPDLARLLRRLKRRDARRRGGPELTYREIAARTGWSSGIVAHYFTGKTLPPTDRFDALVRLLGASPAEQGRLATIRDRVDENRRTGNVIAATPAVSSAQADIRVLGPVEVSGPDGKAVLSGARQRTLLALLALQAGTAIGHDGLIAALWPDPPPRTAIRTLQAHAARVRQALDRCGLAGVLPLGAGTGYLLDVRPWQVDAARFEDLHAHGRRALADGAHAEAAAHLFAALDLWRGPALQDAEVTGWGAAEARRLDEARLCAGEDLWDARLKLGEHEAAVDGLARLLAAHPARERLVGLYMLALYRCGQPLRAADAFRRLRAHLAEEYGVEPGPALQRLHSAVLRRDAWLEPGAGGDAGTAVVGEPRPAQLPPRIGHFVGRTREMSLLDVSGVAVICGPAGMGKTALAVQWAHDNAGRFPDGQLFVELRGHDPAQAVPVAETLSRLLRGLGLTGDLGTYRSALRGRRLLILLDDAGSAAQVAPLVPPEPGSLLVVTSRNRLEGLAIDHEVTRIPLEELGGDESMKLLGRVLGVRRVAEETDAAQRLVRLCGGMPLALRIASARIAARPKWPISALVAELEGGDRLGALAVGGDSRSVRAVLRGGLAAVSATAAASLRRLGALPGPTFTASLASALTGVNAVEELASAHLVSEVDAGRYRMHDLTKVFAFEQASAEERAEALRSATAWYLVIAGTANRLLEPARDRVRPGMTLPPGAMPQLRDAADVLELLDAERGNVLPLVRLAIDGGHAESAWQLVYLMTSFHTRRGYVTEQLAMGREGLRAALRTGDPVAERLMLSILGTAHNATGGYHAAIEHFTRARALMREGGDRAGEGVVLNNLALAHAQLGRVEAAAALFGEALAVHTEAGNLPGVALARSNLGSACLQLGRMEEAEVHLRHGLKVAQRMADAHLEGALRQNLGEAALAAGDPDAALRELGRALLIRRRIGERRREAETSGAIGLLLASRGDNAAATLHFGRMLELAGELDDRGLAAAAREALAGLREGHDR